MRASAKRFSSIMVAILFFIASIFIYNSLIQPAYSGIKDLRAEIATRLDLIATNQNSIQQVQNLLTQYQNAADIQQTTSLILPLSQDIALGADQINGLSKINNLSIELLGVQQVAIKPSKQPNLVKGIGTSRFNFRLNGAYENFKAFLQAVETNINLTDLVSLKIEPATSRNNFLYTMTVDTYYQSE